MEYYATEIAESRLAYFSGTWTEGEKQVVRQTLRRFEERMILPRGIRSALWTCSYVSHPRGVYMLSRYKMESVITARSVEELRMRLLDRVGAVATF